MNTRYKRILIALALLVAGACAFLFDVIYSEAKSAAVEKLNEEQMIHAKQAAQGIQDFFTTWTQRLSVLSKTDEIIDNSASGNRLIRFFYEANQAQITSITRVDERGVIIYNFPATNLVGTDLSAQKHVRELLRDRKTVISDVFRAAEGDDAVALHVPVFKGTEFKGSIGVLIDFNRLAKRYLDVIKVGKTGYAWVISREGRILYTPVPGLTGRSVFEVIKDFPSLVVMVNGMLQGREGSAQYTYDRIGDRNIGQIRKYAVYMPISLGNTFWSVAVASGESDVFSGLTSFRNRLSLVVTALFISGMVFSTLVAKAWLIVTEEEKRKQAEQQLQESAERLRQSAKAAEFGAYHYDFTASRAFFSLESLAIFGLPADATIELDSDLVPRALHPEDKPRFWAHLQSANRPAVAGLADVECRIVHPDGQVRWLRARGRTMFTGDGQDKRPLQASGIIQDITRRKQEEEELHQLRGASWHADRVARTGAITASLAHELNQPLAAILSNAQAAARFLESPNPNLDEIREILRDIVLDDKRAGVVISGLRSMLRRQETRREKIRLPNVIRETLDLLHSELLGRHVAVRSWCESDYVVVGDKAQIQQVLLNLILNAVEAMDNVPADQRRVELALTLPQAHEAQVSVRDFGPGITEEQKPKLFKAFWTSKTKGMGIGLSICRSIVESHGGRIWFANHREGGAIFYFTVPVVKDTPKATET